MAERAADRALRRLFAVTLHVYPADFRHAVGDDLLDLLVDRARDAAASRPAGLAAYVAASFAGVLRDGLSERLARLLPRRRRVDPPGHPPARHPRKDPMRHVADDLRHAARALYRRPGFLAVTAATLALGLGAATTVFGVLDAVLVRPLPYPEPERLAVVGASFGDVTVDSVSWPVVRELAAEGTFDRAAATSQRSMVLSGTDQPVRLEAALVSEAFLPMLGAEPAIGRGFAAADDRPGAPGVALLGHAAWQRRWGGDPSVVGRVLRLDDRPVTVIGVLPARFRPPEAFFGHDAIDLWLPLAPNVRDLEDIESFELSTLVRRAPRAPESAMAAAAARAAEQFRTRYPGAASWDGRPLGLWVEDLHRHTVGDLGDTVMILVGAVALLLLIACANVANLFLARGADRRRELAVKSSLGASQRRLVRLLVLENLLVAMIGASLGVALAWVGTRLFVALSPGDIPRLAEVAVDPRVAAFAFGLALLTGLASGLLPAWRASHEAMVARVALADGLSATAGRRTSWARGGLVVAQVAIATALVLGAGLLVNSLLHMTASGLGFDPSRLTAMTVRLDDELDADRRRAFFQQVEAAAAAAPGLESVAMGSSIPALNSGMWTNIRANEPADAAPSFVRTNAISPTWFATLGFGFEEGRPFDRADRADGPPVAIVNRALARQLWGDEPALGRRIRMGSEDRPDRPPLTVVGVVADIKQRALHVDPEPELYRPFAQVPQRRMRVVARSGLGAQATGVALRQALASVDPRVVMIGLHDLEHDAAASIGEPRFYTALLGGFAGVALLLAVIGVFGSLSYRVARRLREMGIRMALGAAAVRVTAMVLAQGLVLAALGLVVGLGLAFALTPFLGAWIYGIGSHDAATFATVTALLLAVAALACYLPARRAARVDPVRVLRAE